MLAEQMTPHIGTKTLSAIAMNKQEYCDYRGWDVPENEDPAERGYLVEYHDGGESNHPDHQGYISWSPADVFERAYRPMEGMSFGLALEALKKGLKVTREGWNGKGMFLFLVPGSTFQVNRPPLLGIYEEGTEIHYRPHIDMKTVDGEVVPWVASQSDLFCEDWQVVE